jgi:hypothetical protein
MSEPMSALARFKGHLENTSSAQARGARRLAKEDPWVDRLKSLKPTPSADHSIIEAVDVDGQPEWRVKSCYLLDTVLGLAAERINSAHQRRLGTVMRRLGWIGPKTIWFRTRMAKGYFRPAEDA